MLDSTVGLLVLFLFGFLYQGGFIIIIFFFFFGNTCYLSSSRKKNVSSQWRESAIDIRSTSFTFSLPLAVE